MDQFGREVNEWEQKKPGLAKIYKLSDLFGHPKRRTEQ